MHHNYKITFSNELPFILFFLSKIKQSRINTCMYKVETYHGIYWNILILIWNNINLNWKIKCEDMRVSCD